MNDQLLEVNGVKLEGLSNSSAMEALRLAMIQDGKIPGVISLTVARQTGKSETHQVSPSSSKSDGSGQSRSQSDSEVGTILLSHSPSGTVSHIYDVNQSDFSPASLDRFHRYPDLGNIELNTNSHHTNYTDSNTAVTTKINFDKHFKGTVSDSKIFQFQSVCKLLYLFFFLLNKDIRITCVSVSFNVYFLFSLESSAASFDHWFYSRAQPSWR